MKHNTVSATIRLLGVFLRFRVSRDLSLWKLDDHTLLLSLSVHQKLKRERTIRIHILGLLVLIGRVLPHTRLAPNSSIGISTSSS